VNDERSFFSGEGHPASMGVAMAVLERVPHRVLKAAPLLMLSVLLLFSGDVAASDISFDSEYFFAAVAIVFFLMLPINMFWYSLGCAALMKSNAWRFPRPPALSGRPLRRRIAMTVVLITVCYAVIDLFGEGITNARTEGLNAGSSVSLALIFLSVLAFTSLLLKIDLRGSIMISAGMTLVSAVTWAFISGVYGGDGGSNPMGGLVIYIILCAIMSVIVLRRITGREAGSPPPKKKSTKTD